MNTTWTPDSWRARPIKQVPLYPDQAALTAMEAKLRPYEIAAARYFLKKYGRDG